MPLKRQIQKSRTQIRPENRPELPQSVGIERRGLRVQQLAAVQHAREVCAEARELQATSKLLRAELLENIEKSKHLIKLTVRTRAQNAASHLTLRAFRSRLKRNKD